MKKPQAGAARKPSAKKPSLAKPKKSSKKRRRAIAPLQSTYHPGPLIDCEAALAAAVAGLRAQDTQVVSHMLEVGGPTPLRQQKPGFEGLALIIISQQVSVASAEAIARRVRQHIVPLDAAAMLAADDDRMRLCGLSGPKIRAMRALSTALAEGSLVLDALAAMSPEDAHQALIKIKGIGPWTADIFLLFCLGHPDAWPVGDIALQEAARIALKLKSRPGPRALHKIGERWRPWRGVAARILWSYYRVAKSRDGMTLAGM